MDGKCKTNQVMIFWTLWSYCDTWDVGTYFNMYGKRRPLAIIWYQLHVWGGGDNLIISKTWNRKVWSILYINLCNKQEEVKR